MGAYYNEIDPYAAQWLRNLIAAGHIAPGDVDERSIEDVKPDDLRGYMQCHFFAGIGVWSYALRRAGWPDDRPVWSASCPCQPFSAAGKGAGFADERHLWPAVDFLVGECRPPVLFGEQVASKDGLAWLDTVQADLEGKGYAVGALDLCAAGVGAPHIRQRLYFVADADKRQRGRLAGGEGRERDRAATGRQQSDGELERGVAVGELAYAGGERRQQECRSAFGDEGPNGGQQDSHNVAASDGEALVVGDAEREGLEGHGWDGDYPRGRSFPLGSVAASGAVGGRWRDAWVVYCRDGKLRPVEPGTFPLAHGAPARVGRLRGYGNAIVAPLAEEFIKAYLAG